MKITQVRNATMIIEIDNTRFLVDPMLSSKGTLKAFKSLERPDVLNPLCDLPFEIDDIINVDAVIITHLHSDHFDIKAIEVIDKDMIIYAQNDNDIEKIKSHGFNKVYSLKDNPVINGISLFYVKGQHTDDMINPSKNGETCGVIFKSENNKTLYLTGDTIYFDSVRDAIINYNPMIIIANAGDNKANGNKLIMGKSDILKLHDTKDDAIIIATHMEDLNHWTLSKKELRDFSVENKFDDKLIIPRNGETIIL